MKIKKAYNNDELKDALKDSKDIYSTFTSGIDLDDDELAKIDRFNGLCQLDKDILLLYSTIGATKTAELYGISRQYVYELINRINDKLNV